jgi:hypothetical protein
MEWIASTLNEYILESSSRVEAMLLHPFSDSSISE